MDKTDIKLDRFGNVDVDYYVAQAQQLRREYLSQLGASIKTKVKAFFRVEGAKLSGGHRHSASH
ncbi:RSP_7527 family protein [Gallaecimonas mangrovi]|uniref:RSP_7527 family protein n=1 Tax=Gallaecimonas mangrovi TaxID=2291597 RepID=UPI000E1FB5A4|nr:hypothetical protein [Gallaecimonas mangrovi]